MVARNDITGDAIQTRGVSDAYRNNYDLIFGKNKMQIKATENTEGFAACGCGRSPSGVCNGYHALTDEQWAAKLAEVAQEDTNKPL